MEWLLDIGKTNLNKERVIFVSRVLLLLPILIFVFALLIGSSRMIGQTLQLFYDLGLGIMCLALMVVVYEHNLKIPVIGYYAIVTVIKGVYLFFISSIGTEHGELYTLIFVLSLILHTIVGYQLFKTDFSVFGKAFLIYLGGIVLASFLSSLDYERYGVIVSIVSYMILVYPFYRELPNYYNN